MWKIFLSFAIAFSVGSGVSFAARVTGGGGSGSSSSSSTGTASLPLPPGDTNYIQNTNALQSGSTFFVSSGTVAGQFTVSTNGSGASLNLYGLFTVDRPDLGSGVVSRSSLIFNPNSSNPFLNMRAYGATASNMEYAFQDSNGNEIGSMRANPGSTRSFSFNFSSSTNVSPVSRWGVSAILNGVQDFNDQNGNTMVEFSPVGNSSFTIPVYLSTLTIHTQLLDGNGSAGSATNVLTSNGASSAPTWQASSGGGGSSIYSATSTAFFPFGASFSTMTMTNLSTGVMHIVAGSSNVAVSPVLLVGEVSGILPRGNGGTGTSINPIAGQFLIGGTGGAYALGFINAGSGITVSTSGGTVTVFSTGPYTNLSPGVMHIVQGSSSAVTGLVSLSTEVTGVLPLANISSGATYYIQNTASLQSGASFYIGGIGVIETASTTVPLTLRMPNGLGQANYLNLVNSAAVAIGNRTDLAFKMHNDADGENTFSLITSSVTSVTVNQNKADLILQTYRTTGVGQGGMIEFLRGSAVNQDVELNGWLLNMKGLGISNIGTSSSSFNSSGALTASSGTITTLYSTTETITATGGNGAVFLVNTATGSNIFSINTVPAGIGNIFQVQDSTGRALISIDGAGHVVSASTQPVLSSCGTGPTLSTNSNDFAGTVTVGSAASGCTVTFANVYTNAPSCVVSERTMSLTNSLSYTTSTSALTLTETTFGGVVFDYVCSGH